MFRKVLIAEDHESANISVQRTLSDLGITHDTRNYVFYCDDALMRIKKGLRDNEPYDLLITDLSFEEDTPNQKITNGPDLIKAVRELQPEIKVLVFSIENRAFVASALVGELDIDAFVPKARHDAKDLKLAIETICKDKKYLSPNLRRGLREQNTHNFTNFDITIISLLSNGTSQKQIPVYLRENNIKPAGLSSVEKRLSFIRDVLGFSKNEQLVAYCKDIGVI